MRHTPEPWVVDLRHITADEYDFYVAICYGPKGRFNARRIAAAVNACQGISTGALQAGVVRELINALSTTVCAACDTPVGKLERDWDCPACRRARETLTKVRGEGA